MTEFNVLVSVDTDDNLDFIGVAEAANTHHYGMPHTTVLLIPVVKLSNGQPGLILHQRSPYKRTSPGKLDFNGGHVTFSESCFTGTPWQSPYDLESATWDAALREANEELQFTPPFRLERERLTLFGRLGSFRCHTETATGPNIEFSTCFIVSMPFLSALDVFDTDPLGERELPLETLTLVEVLERFRKDRSQFADGAERVLTQLANSRGSRSEFEQLIRTASQLG
jgi:hypothetical protein